MDLLSALLIIIILILIWKIFRSSFSNSIYDKYDYFDYAATTPPYEEALCYNDIGAYQGNLSQSYNKENRENLEKINRTILGQIFHNNEDYRLIWTSGASEANNTVIKSFCKDGKKIIMGNTEHHTSLACIEDNTKDYILYDFRYLDNLYQSITPDTVLVSIMHVNNEIGYVYDLEKISEIIKLYRKNNGTSYPYLHSDMSQSMGKLPVKNVARNLDIITASAHKFYGPLGVGFIAINKNIPLTPLIYGTQQDGLRGGTVNYPGILTASKSFLISISNMENEMRRASHYSDFIRNCLMDNFSAINAFDLNRSKINRPVVAFYPNTSPYILSFSIITDQGKFSNIKLKEKMLAKNIIIGTGSACSIGSSTVLNNLSLPHVANQGFIRLSFGRLTSDKSIRKLAKNLIYEIKKMLEEC